MSWKTWMSLTPLAALVASGACLDESATRTRLPLDTAEVGFIAAANLRSAASAWTDATDWIGDDDMADWLVGLPAAVTGAADDADVIDPSDPSDPIDPNAGDDLGAMAEDLADRLENELLVSANLEAGADTEDGRVAIYLIPAATVCGGDEDPECLARFTAHPLRVRVVSYAAEDLDVTLLVGEARLEPLTIELHHASLAVTVDVGQAFAALDELGVLAGDGDASKVALRHIAGKLTARLERRGAHAARAAFEVSSPLAIDLDVVSTSGPMAITAGLGRSSVSLDLDGAAHRLSFEGKLGALTASAPFQLLADLMADEDATPARVDGTLALDLAGASGSVTLTGNATPDAANGGSITVENVGLGDHRSTLKVDGNTIAGLDLNASSGRKLAVTVSRSADGESVEVGVSPELDVVAELGLRFLAPIDADLATGWAANETLGIALDGASRPTVRVGEGLEVVSGRLALESRSRPELSVEVTAGQCLVASESANDADHPFAGFASGACDPR